MKLIIDIDEDVRIAISRMGLLRIPDEMQKKVDKAIQSGTPLDKTLNEISDNINKLKKVSDGNKVYVGINNVFEVIDKYKKGANE